MKIYENRKNKYSLHQRYDMWRIVWFLDLKKNDVIYSGNTRKMIEKIKIYLNFIIFCNMIKIYKNFQ